MLNENRMCELADMKERLISCMKSELAKGLEQVDASEAGEVIDMIKDIAQCEKNCWEAEYYRTVVEAMEEDDDEDDEYEMRMGYRKPSKSHRFEGSKYRHRPYTDQMPYIDAYLNDPQFRENMRMGYDLHHKTDSERITDMMANIREIWKRAEPELKTRMKTDFNALIGEMK